MNNWQDDLKKYVVRKHKELTGEELSIEAISDVDIDFDVNLNDLSIEDLGNMYSFALMMERYEFAQKIHNELKSRNCDVNVTINDEINSGFITITVLPKSKVIRIDMKIIPTGLIVDFDKLR